MPTLAGNITTLSITEAAMLAREGTLNTYLPVGQADWSDQIAAGKVDAEEAIASMTGLKPERMKARTDAHWERILVAFTLLVIYRQMEPAEHWTAFVKKWEDTSELWLSRFLWDYDKDESGEISDTIDEGPRRAREIQILRG